MAKALNKDKMPAIEKALKKFNGQTSKWKVENARNHSAEVKKGTASFTSKLIKFNGVYNVECTCKAPQVRTSVVFLWQKPTCMQLRVVSVSPSGVCVRVPVMPWSCDDFVMSATNKTWP